MANNLTDSAIDRQNILNNSDFIENIQKFLGVTGMLYDGEYRFTTAQIADFYEVSTKTVKRYVESAEPELSHNGYCVLKGQKLKEFKQLFGYLIYADIEADFEEDINVPFKKNESDKQKLSKLRSLAVFNFRTFLNIGMMLTESERAKSIRSTILDIVLDSINQKIGGQTKFINQRDEEYFVAILREPVYRKEFTSALSQYLEMGNAKYSIYTDAIYQAIFHENATEYKAILKLEDKESPRETMYSEVLKLIASFEIGIADAMKDKYEEIGRKLTPNELNHLIKEFTAHRFWIPQLEDARIKMASRDYGFREVVHSRLEKYIQSIPTSDFQKFLGENSKSLQERVDENIEIFKRLKDR
ncbi:DNA-binding protein [Belliella sp. DSM 107340]|uniref:DNA-binding protein n=1 Tax=Belliella calami TaxID=2923436 RepID=A0ABS9UQS3_9BACT|nr:DNA-binding protein [Belliella calami]MCH7398878.1 DNA-binding protein [Belliella calami]